MIERGAIGEQILMIGMPLFIKDGIIYALPVLIIPSAIPYRHVLTK